MNEGESRSDPEKVFLDQLEHIERAASYTARRANFPRQDVEDFVSVVKLKLIDDDYAALRKHRGESSITTYLTVVINNQFKDFCNQRLGKYRSSAVARKLGPAATTLERMLVVEKRDLESAVEIVKARGDVTASRDELREIADQLPERTYRRFVGEEELEQRASQAPESVPERRLVDGEPAATASRVEEVLNTALSTLSAQDLLLLKMFYRDGLTIATIASMLRLEQRPLYTRKAKSLKTLRAAFESEGLTWDEVRRILGWEVREIRTDFGPADVNEDVGSVQDQ